MVESSQQEIPHNWRLQQAVREAHNNSLDEWSDADADANVFAFEELKALSNTRCATCTGYGHAERDCPTKGRLTNYGKQGGAIQGVVTTLMKRVGRDSQVVGGVPTLKTSLYK